MADADSTTEPNTGEESFSKDSGKSLSTIPEEPTSVPTVSSKTDHDFSISPSSSTELPIDKPEKPKKKEPLPLPKLPEPILPRKKRHTSTLLGSSSRATVLPHDCPRTLSMQERLLTHIQCAGRPLFPTVVGEHQVMRTASFLVSGFGLRNLGSLQEALKIEEQNRLKQLYLAQQNQDQSSSSTKSSSSGSLRSAQISRPKIESSSETQTDGSVSRECPQKKQLMYLMGLQPTAEGAEDEEEEEEQEEGSHAERATLHKEEGGRKEELSLQLSESMKQAQKYLRVHKIFEFFQFIISHLLSALPENPIQFILDLLDKCVIYRAGLTDPPLLYSRKHLECLFYLMDKMHTGYIELDQYQTGMQTVGIYNFNKNPPLTSDGMITKQDFIDEAYDCLTHLLSDILRRRWIRSPAPITPPPPPTPQISTEATSTTGEYPSGRFTRTRLFLDCI